MKYSIFICFLLLFLACKESSPATTYDQIIVASSSYDFANNSTIDELKRREQQAAIYAKYPATKTIEQKGLLYHLYIIKSGEKQGIIDGDETTIVPLIYDNIYKNNEGLVFQKDSLFQFFNSDMVKQNEVIANSIWKRKNALYILNNSSKGYDIYNSKGQKINKYLIIKKPIILKNASYFLAYDGVSWEVYDMNGDNHKENLKANISRDLLEKSKVGLHGYGPIRLGHNKVQLEKSVGTNLETEYLGEECQMYSFGDNFMEMSLLFEDDILSRIYILEVGVNTFSNIGINSSSETLENTYKGKLESQPNKYSENGRDYFFVPVDEKDKKYRLNFFVNNGVIDSYSLGLLPAILFVEGCH